MKVIDAWEISIVDIRFQLHNCAMQLNREM